MEKIINNLYSLTRKDEILNYRFTFYNNWVVESFNEVSFIKEGSSEGITLYNLFCIEDLSDIEQHNKIVDYVGKIIELNEKIDNKNKEIEEQIKKFKDETDILKKNLLEDFKKNNIDGGKSEAKDRREESVDQKSEEGVK